MTNPSHSTPQYDFPIWRGTPLPIVIQNVDVINGVEVVQPFAATLALRVKVRKVAAFTLTVGQGITLQTIEGVADGQATILLTEAQSNLIPLGRYATYELTEGVAGSLSLVLAGNLVGEEAQ